MAGVFTTDASGMVRTYNSGPATSTYTGGGGLPSTTGGIPQAPRLPAPLPTIMVPDTLAKQGKNPYPDIVKNPWAQSMFDSAKKGGQFSTQQGADNIFYGGGIRDAGRAVLNNAFDPQNALYNRTAQQLQDQVRVGQAARGITSSPYGAGLENSAMANFNIDWQNNLLNRQVQGLGAAGTAGTQAANLGNTGVQQTTQGGAMPYDAFRTNQSNDIQNWIAYINAQNAQTSVAQANYPLSVESQSYNNFGGVPYIPNSQPLQLKF